VEFGDRGVHENCRQVEIAQPRVVVVRGILLGVLPADEDDPRHLLLEEQVDVIGL
jgi:hypothetical protein